MTEEKIEQLGRGIALQETTIDGDRKTWDLDIGGDGDIGITRGVPELKKDISFKVGRVLETARGQNITRNYLSRVESVVENVLNRDERIDTVEEVRVIEDEDDPDKFHVEAKVISITAETVLLEI